MKKPKRPKSNAGLKSWESYNRRLDDYKKVKDLQKKTIDKANKL